MKTQQTPEGTMVEEPLNAIDVVYAGLGALVCYYEQVSPNGPYAPYAFRMCEQYCGMLNDISARGDQHVYHAHFQEFLSDILELGKPEGKDGGEAQENPQG